MVREISAGGVVIRNRGRRLVDGRHRTSQTELSRDAPPARPAAVQQAGGSPQTESRALPAQGPGRSRRESPRSCPARGPRRDRNHRRSHHQARQTASTSTCAPGAMAKKSSKLSASTCCDTSPDASTISPTKCESKSPARTGFVWKTRPNYWPIAARNRWRARHSSM